VPIALAAKNGILIVARGIECLRFRPVMMTSFAFIFGLFPPGRRPGPPATPSAPRVRRRDRGLVGRDIRP